MCDMVNDALNKLKKKKKNSIRRKEEKKKIINEEKTKTYEADSSIILRTGRWSSWTNYRNGKRNRAEIEESSIRSTTDLFTFASFFSRIPSVVIQGTR